MGTSRPIRTQRGSAAVEFALVLPLALLLLLALVQVGLYSRDRLLVESAARAGARPAAVTEDPTAVRAAALTAAPALVDANLDLTVTRAGARGDPVTVSIRYLDPIRVPFVGWLVGSGVTMHASVAARQEFG